jgi:hypothetical protein
MFAARSDCQSTGSRGHVPSADAWLTNSVVRSAPYDFSTATPHGFESLRADVLSNRLKAIFAATDLDTNHPPRLVFSVEAPGHWPSRDWIVRPMRFLNGLWECAVPVEDPDVTVVYFLQVTRGLTNAQSPLRICVPRLAGLETPTQLFWPYLEGFESGGGQWHLLSGPGEPEEIEISREARSGEGALRIKLPDGGRSRTVATTRVRGSVLERCGATGVRLWMRTGRGTVRVRFTLVANADTAVQVVSPNPRFTEVTDRWSEVDVPLSAFAGLPVGQVDRFTIECVSESPGECFVDDVQLLGPWNAEAL